MITFDKETERKRIGARIATLREARGLSQEQLAEMAGINRVTLTNAELGKFSIGFDVLTKLSLALGCTVDLIESK